MADRKVTALPALTALDGTERFLAVQDGVTGTATAVLVAQYVQSVLPAAGGGSGSGPSSTDALPEGSGNLYFRTDRVRSAISVSGALSYNSSTGVISYTAPVLATVATSGAYGDLTGKPALFSGNYADLIGKPTIPTVPTSLSAFTNDAGYVTAAGARGAISVTGSGSYNATTGVITITGGSAYTLPAATATTLGGVKANAGTTGQFVNGIAGDGSLTYGTPAGGSATPLGNANPQAPGTASAGTSTNASREDHVHPTDTSRQAANTNLTALSGLTGAASRLPGFTGAGAMALVPYGTSGISTLVQTDVAGKLPALDGSQLTNLPSGTTLGSVTPSMDGTAAVGTATTAAHSDHVHPTDTSRAKAGANSDITSLTGLTTALSIAQGGTGATTATAALTSLGAQASSALLTAIAGVSAAANKVLAFTGATAATVLSYGSTAAANILLQLDANGRINAQQTQNLRETVNALGSVSGTATIDLSLGDVVTATMTAATTFSFTNPPATGISKSFVLKLTTGGFTPTFPAAVKWQGGTAPTFAAAGSRNRLWFTTEDAGTTYDGASAGSWT